MNKYLLLLLFLVFSINSFSQVDNAVNYYVSSNSLNVRSGASVDSSIVLKLKKYDNILNLESTSQSEWVKIKSSDITGYVSKNFIKEGRSIISTYSVRTGAICRDGTRSSATGRGACSHHGGVSRWITKQKQSVRIVDN